MSKFEEHLPSTADDEKLARKLQEWEDEEQSRADPRNNPTATQDEELARRLQAEWDSRNQDHRAAAQVRSSPRQVSFAAAPQEPQMTGALPALQYSRDATRVMAYMIPLPQPLRHGVPQDIPQRYMLYMPPAPDLLKPTEKGSKERKRDKVVRRWQQEVKKAKTFNGKVVSLGGIHSASFRGAVWCLNVIKPSDVTFLSRVPRKTVQSLVLVHPEDSRTQSTDDMFNNVKGELSRTKSRTKRDFLIGTALLPFTVTIDLVIPVFGGLSEVNMVWMAVNASAWMTAKKVVNKLRPAEEDSLAYGGNDGAMMLRTPRTGDGYTGNIQPQQDNDERRTDDNEGRKKDDKDKTIQMVFRPSPAMDLMRRYVEEACHKRNPDAFPSPAAHVPGESEVLASMGWSPERREVPDAEDDVAWQIRKVTEDLRAATGRAAKSWDSWAKKYMKNPKRALDEENEDSDDSEDEEELKPELPKRPPVHYR
ncbi:hypothetical protein J7T55_006931 [Diaporthe amygdali]|uniref:uncharacterized protein n=1 Tax=Phomopsis amygdali TaxID=1214568 RepID=UPI0022FE2689|nr:uncharacterized protein J7T55_006931 [Diaporthe amygdali]KAJ0107053.1 hypothetical protein J7T55_006931 [Diaporthe amygdali]